MGAAATAVLVAVPEQTRDVSLSKAPARCMPVPPGIRRSSSSTGGRARRTLELALSALPALSQPGLPCAGAKGAVGTRGEPCAGATALVVLLGMRRHACTESASSSVPAAPGSVMPPLTFSAVTSHAPPPGIKACAGDRRHCGAEQAAGGERGLAAPTSRRSPAPLAAMPRVYIGRLSYHVREKDIQRFFSGYGRLLEVDLKNG